jgi:adenine-specific DNA-methyltransferase
VPFRELKVVPEKSLPAEGLKPSLDDNLIIHGDNLEALKALLPTHAGKVDCIFIDPPYNTGNEGWCYNDNVRSPLMKGNKSGQACKVAKEQIGSGMQSCKVEEIPYHSIGTFVGRAFSIGKDLYE